MSAARTNPSLLEFEALYRAEFAFVWSAARRLGVASAVHEDVVQEVFFTVYRRLEQLRFEVSARAWLYGVTRRVAARYRRTAARRARRLTAVAEAHQGPTGAPQERVIAAQQLERGLSRLGGRTREAFEMAEVLGMSGPEIAAELGLPVATVYSRIRLAREQLVAALGDQRVDRGLAAIREDDEPAPATAQRCWLGILPGLSGETGGAGLAAWVTGRVMATVLVVAGAGVVVVVQRGEAPARGIAGAPVRAVGSVRTEVRTEEVVEDRAGEEDAAVEEVAPIVRMQRGERVRGADDRLAAEVALLDRAREALGREPAEALVLLAEHARRFPDGALVDLRGAVEVEALCLQGRADEADARAAALVAGSPGSTVAQRFVNFSCGR